MAKYSRRDVLKGAGKGILGGTFAVLFGKSLKPEPPPKEPPRLWPSPVAWGHEGSTLPVETMDLVGFDADGFTLAVSGVGFQPNAVIFYGWDVEAQE